MTFIYCFTRNENVSTTTIMGITNIFGTFRMIVTIYICKYTRTDSFRSIFITGISSTIVIVITSYIRINTSLTRETICTLARVSVLTFNRGIDTSFYGITTINGAKIVIITINQRVPATTTWVTTILCTYIIIIAGDSSGFTTYSRVA